MGKMVVIFGKAQRHNDWYILHIKKQTKQQVSRLEAYVDYPNPDIKCEADSIIMAYQ